MDSGSPLIAVNGLLEPGAGPHDARVQLRLRYAEALVRAGCVPVPIAPVGGARCLRPLLARVDGLLLPGGDDFDTERLGLGPTHPAAVLTPAVKQDFDFELARIALELELPVLGLCYGMQLLVLAEGGSLHQHLPDDRPGARDHTGGARHAVRVSAGSKLAGALGVDRLDVVSRHHQAVADPGPRWTVAARDDEGLIEAVERRGHPFAIGVQWHPELSPVASPNARLFDALARAAGARCALHEPSPTPLHR